MQAAAAEPWLQPRGDAEATGFQEEDGPAWPDVALDVQLEGSMRAEADTAPLILEDRVLFLARPFENTTDDDYRVFSVDLDTTEVTVVAEGIERADRLRLATDGERVFVSSQGKIHGFPLTSSGDEWTWVGEGPDPLDEMGEPVEVTLSDWRVEWCGWMAVRDGNITALCAAENPSPFSPFGVTSLAVRLDASTGNVHWWWNANDDREEDGFGSWPVGLAVSHSRAVFLLSVSPCFRPTGPPIEMDYCSFSSEVWAVDLEGEYDWDEKLQSVESLRFRVEDESVIDESESLRNVGNPAISGGAVYVKAGQIHKLNIGDGETIWSRGIGEQDVDPDGGRSGAISLGNGHLYTTSEQTIYSINQENEEDGWTSSLDFSTQEGFRENPVATPSAVYTVIASPDEPETIVAFSTEDGRDLWRHEAGEEVWALSVGQGLVAYTQTEFVDDETAKTSLVMLGETDASPVAKAVHTTRYPGLGEAVEVDVSASEAGLQGPVTRYKAIWGDGSVTDWQESAVLTHRYAEEGDMEARFIVGNDANQTASTVVTFHVGQEPPVELNLLQKMFARENQDLTFGVLGVFLALSGGMIGVAHRHRKQNRLKDALESVERAYAETRDEPVRCEAQLTERRAHAKGLLLDGELTETQFQVVEDRIEQLRRELRESTVEDQFDFLPMSLVKGVHEMLHDGRVTKLEKQAFLDALDADESVHPDQKTVVRQKILEWHARDTGGKVE